MSSHPFGDAPKERLWAVHVRNAARLFTISWYAMCVNVGIDEYAYATSRDERRDED